jgi:hypothetical protein
MFLDPLLKRLLEERKINLIIFQAATNRSFCGLFFEKLLGDILSNAPIYHPCHPSEPA